MVDSTILPIPSIPRAITDAIDNENLAVFVGAGVSRIIGCKGWDDLAGNLIKKCTQIEKPSNGQLVLNFRETEVLLRDRDHKKVITICYELMKENDCEGDFFTELDSSFRINETSKYRDLYRELYGLRALFITTNADTHFDALYNPERIVIKNFHPDDIDRTKLYHIHGSINDRDTLVFTVHDYIRRYQDDDFKSFLERIFDKFTVIFMGYGMNEFELLDFIVTKYGTLKEKEIKHYILRPYYSGEETSLRFEQLYYSNMGVSVIPYLKDENGYNQLYEVVKEWRDVINKTSGYLYDTFNKIEELVDQYDG